MNLGMVKIMTQEFYFRGRREVSQRAEKYERTKPDRARIKTLDEPDE